MQYYEGGPERRYRISTHVRKKLDALGKFCARIVGMDDGSSTRSGREAMIPDANVTIKNEC